MQPRRQYPALAEFASTYDFAFDAYQTRACEALEAGSGVLLAAPTGAGKTVVGEFATHLALRTGKKCFYTTPIKALSNQKYADLCRRHGAANVGLLTGDNSVNGEAPVVVMTTEVLRNMLYAGSATLHGLGWVVMDEVHYLADRLRGAVWEEVIIHLPASVTLVSLSATVSNTEEFADWLVTVRGHTEVVLDEVRPVPLWQHMLVGRRMFDLLDPADPRRVAPSLQREVQERLRQLEASRAHSRGRLRFRPTHRPDVVDRLDRDGLLPAIFFVFSRAGCQAAVEACVRSGLRLTDPDEVPQIRAVVHERTAAIPPEDLHVLGYAEWLDALERGIAAHHAGMLPTFKEVVEELFVRGLIRAVFATETLALGINMPARSVVLERLVKWNGEAHAQITAGEYTQLTGRAGRRGIDVEGHAVVVWSPDVDPRHAAGLASRRTYPLRSSFRPSYNMAVNLVGTVTRERAAALLELSFAQFQADRSVLGPAQQVGRNLAELDELSREMACERGDVTEYARLRAELSQRETVLARERGAARRAAAVASLEALRPGDVIEVPSGRRAGIAVVLDPGHHAARDPRPLVLTAQRWAGRLSPADVTDAVRPLAHIRVPRGFNHRSPQARRDLASTLRTVRLERPDVPRRGGSTATADGTVARLRAEVRAHPCHACPDREAHARLAERWHQLRRETDALERSVHGRTTTLARTFERVCAVLERRGYLDGDTVTPDGRRLARIWAENDLLVAECLRSGAWEDLGPADLAAVASALVFESRSPQVVTVVVNRSPVRAALGEMARLWAALAAEESDARLSLTRRPDPGFAAAAYAWTSGQTLTEVLAGSDEPGSELTAGDFVRWCRQVVDLLSQLAEAAPERSTVGPAARTAITRMRRGVVALSPLED